MEVVGCGRDHAILDGMQAGSVLDGVIELLSLADLSLANGRAAAEQYSCGEESECWYERPALIHGVWGTLEMNRVALTGAVQSSDGAGFNPAVWVKDGSSAEDPETSGGTVTGQDCTVQRNFVDANSPAFYLSTRRGGALDLMAFDWGEGDDENGNSDVAGPAAGGSYEEWDLEGVVDVTCPVGGVCRFEEH